MAKQAHKGGKDLTHSLNEVRDGMTHYLDLSAERLRGRLRLAWKKQQRLKIPDYAYERTAVFRAGAR